jgi:isocitrate/isopropylmalate dehydrogenase
MAINTVAPSKVIVKMASAFSKQRNQKIWLVEKLERLKFSMELYPTKYSE